MNADILTLILAFSQPPFLSVCMQPQYPIFYTLAKVKNSRLRQSACFKDCKANLEIKLQQYLQ